MKKFFIVGAIVTFLVALAMGIKSVIKELDAFDEGEDALPNLKDREED
jgi:hypothetical protein